MKYVQYIFIAATPLLAACPPRATSPTPTLTPTPTPAPTSTPTLTPTPTPTPTPTLTPTPTPTDGVERGNATWYGARLAGHKTASGERFDPSAMTAAHKTLPLGTVVDVRRAGTDRVVRVRINDRGPFGTPDKIIDLSSGAFARLASLRDGVIAVEVRVVAK